MDIVAPLITLAGTLLNSGKVDPWVVNATLLMIMIVIIDSLVLVGVRNRLIPLFYSTVALVMGLIFYGLYGSMGLIFAGWRGFTCIWSYSQER